MQISAHVPYVVVDTETTGIDARRDRVIEIGAVRVEGGRVTETFSTFVDPGVRIPHRITRLTGITNADLVGAPSPADAWDMYLDFAGDSVRVAHNAGFDRRFIASELARLGLDGETAPYLCTVLLSRRLLPGLPSKSLDSVARFLGAEIGTRHRALADAELTAHVLMRLSERAERMGRSGAQGLLSLQKSRYVATGATSEHVDTILKEVIPGLPEGPGVYRMFDQRDRLLYVGKAVSLKRRVGSYFVAVEAKPSRIRDLVTKARRIEVEETDSELEALILEARLIRDLQPPYNRALKQVARRAWLRIASAGEPASGAPMFGPAALAASSAVGVASVHSAPASDGATWYGPISSPGEAAMLAEVLGAAFGLDVRRKPVRTPYDTSRRQRLVSAAGMIRAIGREAPEPVAQARTFLSGDVDGVLADLESAMGRASADFRFEEAGVIRDWIEGVRRLAEEPGPLVDRLEGGDSVHLRFDQDGITAAVTRAGRGVAVFRTDGEDFLAEEATRLLVSGDGDFDPEARRIVAQWAYRYRSDIHWIARGAGESIEAFVRRVADLCRQSAGA